MSANRSSRLMVGLVTENGEWASVNKGEPIILTVGVYSAEASRAVAFRASIQEEIEKAEDLLRYGKMTSEEFEKKVSELKKGMTEPIPISLGSINHPWYEAIKFFEVVSEGELRPLEWPLRIMSIPKPEPSVKLGANDLARVSFGLDPKEAQMLNPQKLKIICKLDEATSNQIGIEIQAMPSKPDSKLRSASYFYQRELYEKAIELVEEELAEHPQSVNARFLLGEIQEASGDFESAMKTYLQALDDFESKRTETTTEDPDVLLEKIQKLGYRIKKQSKP